MNKKYKRYIYCLIVINFIFLLFCFFFFGHHSLIGKYVTKCFFSVEDRFADFYNPIMYASDRSLVNDKWTNAPPFLHFICYIIGTIINILHFNLSNNCIDFKTSFYGYFVWLSIAFLISLVFCFQFKKVTNMKNGIIIGFFLICLSYPFIYAVDRGNLVILAALFVNLFIISYEHDLKLSPLWLGISASLKIYPALLGIIYIRDRRWKEIFFSIIIFVVFTTFSLLFFSGSNSFGDTLIDWIVKVKNYSIIGNERTIGLINNCSLKSLFMLISYFLNPLTIHDLVNSISWLSFLINILIIILIFRTLFFKNNHDIYLIVTLIMVIYPVESGVYNLCLLLIPVFYWIYKENDKYIMFYSLILFMGKPFISLVDPIFIILIIVRVLLLRKNEFVNLKEKIDDFRIL